MKKRMNLACIILVVIGYSGIMNAQSDIRPTDGQKKEMRKQMQANVERLKLNENQTESYHELNHKYEKMAREVHDAEFERPEQKEKLDQIREDRTKEMKELLTEEQFVVYLEIESERHEQMRERQRKGKQ